MTTFIAIVLHSFLGGSLAVFLASLFTLSFGTLGFRVILSVVIMLVEGFTLQIDNLFITATVLTGYMLSENL